MHAQLREGTGQRTGWGGGSYAEPTPPPQEISVLPFTPFLSPNDLFTV